MTTGPLPRARQVPDPADRIRYGEEGRSGATPTIYDIARECGVAASTVSRAFSRPGRVKAETAQRIRDTAERLGYRTNPLARALPTGRTSMIGLVLSDITNPVYFEVIRGAQSAAAEAGFTMLLADTQESGELERSALEHSLPVVEGIVLGGSRMSDSAIRMAAKQRPMVVLNRLVADVPSIVSDSARGMRRAAEHLGELGHESITYVAGPEASWADGMRWRALREAGTELELKTRRLGPYPPTLKGGIRAAEDLLGQPNTTAVVAYNDLLAIGLVRGLARLGVQVPEQVSVVGFDNIFGADFCSPALTTVASPLRALGTAAVRDLVAQLAGAPVRTGQAAVLPVRLVVRESTAAPLTRRRGASRLRRMTAPVPAGSA
ncbi:LacI family DNA-binding transcriptional regulator [Motilibacter aurantiacus]|uniref:LacI family DNA-binding transcriptional regulator n=1 Tax=Motilibacter aurantiacus TaxID=2714955 RepID=UPI00140C9DE4|nr:LacI family DNA-binding transcriptional regulator [Motilibacter aurantiacus]NHC46716.1 LacI family transcriptional regulator [Motilibacter aurantiacus]